MGKKKYKGGGVNFGEILGTAAGIVGGPVGGVATNVATNLLMEIFGDDKTATNPRVQRSLNTQGYQDGGVVEVEGGETFETPDGQVGEFVGPNHENGGIDVELPDNTVIYSKRLKRDGKTMKKRKKKRDNEVERVLKALEQNPYDKPRLNTAKRTLERAAQEEAEDILFMELNRLKSTLGYRDDSPDRDRDMNVIPSNQISMDGVSQPIAATGVPSGEQRVMQPGEEHLFPKDQAVVEQKMRSFQQGGINRSFTVTDNNRPPQSTVTIRNALNPMDWGVKEYLGSFGTAFAQAKKEGKKQFLWNGRRYNTRDVNDDLVFSGDAERLREVINTNYPELKRYINRISKTTPTVNLISEDRSLVEQLKAPHGRAFYDPTNHSVNVNDYDNDLEIMNELYAELAHAVEPAIHGRHRPERHVFGLLKHGDHDRYLEPGAEEWLTHRMIEPGISLVGEGNLSEEEIKRIQNHLGVEADGILGPKTYKAIVDRYSDADTEGLSQRDSLNTLYPLFDTFDSHKLLDSLNKYVGIDDPKFQRNKQVIKDYINEVDSMLNEKKHRQVEYQHEKKHRQVEYQQGGTVWSEYGGDTGERKLQEQLKELGYLEGEPKAKPTAASRRAVKAFQKATGLKVDGIAGAKTLGTLRSIVNESTPNEESADPAFLMGPQVSPSVEQLGAFDEEKYKKEKKNFLNERTSKFDREAHLEAAKTYLDSKKGRHEFKPEDLVDPIEKYYKETGYVYPIDLMLTNMRAEGAFNPGDRGRSKWTNPVNWGEHDSGTKLRFKHPKDALYSYIKGMHKNYLGDNKTPDDLAQNFVNKKGYRYASNPDYERKLVQPILNEVRERIGGITLNPFRFEGPLIGDTEMPRDNTRVMASGGLTPSKAKKMLDDGKVYGKPLTDKQKKYFGYVASQKYQLGGMTQFDNAKKYLRTKYSDVLENLPEDGFSLDEAPPFLQTPRDFNNLYDFMGPQYKDYLPDKGRDFVYGPEHQDAIVNSGYLRAMGLRWDPDTNRVFKGGMSAFPTLGDTPGINDTPQIDYPSPTENLAAKLRDGGDEEVVEDDVMQSRGLNLSGNMGDVGTAISGFSPLLTSVINRLGDEENPNYFAGFGEDALNANDAAIVGSNRARDRGMRELRRQANATRRGNQARSVNVQNALDLATLTATDDATAGLMDRYNDAIRRIMLDRSGLENQQDQAIMQGRGQADIADRQDRDQFFTALSSSLQSAGAGLQQMQKNKNIREAAREADLQGLYSLLQLFG
jgi:hypothetical protein